MLNVPCPKPSSGDSIQRDSVIGIDVRKRNDFGIGTYIRHLIDGLAVSGNSEPGSFMLYTESNSAEDLLNLPSGRFKRRSADVGRRSPFQGKLPDSGSLDAYHAPHYLTPDCRPAPLILTVHDCIHLAPPPEPASFRRMGRWTDRLFDQSKRIYHRTQGIIRFKKLVERASNIIAVSGSTADQLMKLTGIPDSRITRIYNCLDDIYRQDYSESQIVDFCTAFHLPAHDYVLYCGNDLYHKNLSGLLVAWSMLSRTAEVPLLVLAGPPRKTMIEHYARSLKLAGAVRFLGPIHPKMMPLLYRGAVCLAFPSLAEGFGLPVVEAMISGIPVVCSDLPVLQEISGGHAVFFDPLDPRQIADAIGSILRGDGWSALHSAAASRFAERYCTEVFVSEHRRVYNCALEGSR